LKAAISICLALVACAGCGPTTRASSLPTDLPPPEYEAPRALDLGPKKAVPAPIAAPSAPAPPPAPSTAPSAPAPPAAAPKAP
jgi:hypothetical protein